MAQQEDIKKLVRDISLDDPKVLQALVVSPYSLSALQKLKTEHRGNWRDKVITFVEGIKTSYDVNHIKNEIDKVLNSRTKLESFFTNVPLWFCLAAGLDILYSILFTFWTGVFLFLVLAFCCGLGNKTVNNNSKQHYTGDTLRLIKDFSVIVK